MISAQFSLFYPMLAMFLWTFLVMLRSVQVRVQARMTGRVTDKYFELFRNGESTEDMLKSGNHLRNLSEFPPLFYFICILILLAGKSDAVFLRLAWAYVIFRVGHGLVHLTFNKVPARFSFFMASNLVLLTLWLRLAWMLRVH